MEKINVITALIDGYIDIEEATKKLNVSERTVYRYKRKYLEEGMIGLVHKLRGKPSNHRESKIEKLKPYVIKSKYRGFGPTLLSEVLSEELGYKINRETLRLAMIRWGLWTPKKRKVKRQLRKRMGRKGMMVQFDGSYHDWLEDGKERCLLLAVDDATGEIMKMKLTRSENFGEVKLMRIKGIKTMEEAEQYFKEYIREHNKKYGVEAVLSGDCHSFLDEDELNKFKWYFGKECERTIRRDGTIQYNKKIYQIKRGETLWNGKKITVKQSLDGKIKLYSGEYELKVEKVYSKM